MSVDIDDKEPEFSPNFDEVMGPASPTLLPEVEMYFFLLAGCGLLKNNLEVCELYHFVFSPACRDLPSLAMSLLMPSLSIVVPWTLSQVL
jgi:hypothetical protein